MPYKCLIYSALGFRRHCGLVSFIMSVTITPGNMEAANMTTWKTLVKRSGSRGTRSATMRWWTLFTTSICRRMYINICASGKVWQHITHIAIMTGLFLNFFFCSVQSDQLQTLRHSRIIFWCMPASAMLSVLQFMRQEFCLLLWTTIFTDQHWKQLMAKRCKFHTEIELLKQEYGLHNGNIPIYTDGSFVFKWLSIHLKSKLLFTTSLSPPLRVRVVSKSISPTFPYSLTISSIAWWLISTILYLQSLFV